MALLFIDGFEGYPNVNSMVQISGSSTAGWVSMYIANAGGIALNSTTYRTTQVTPANSRSFNTSLSNSGLTDGVWPYAKIPAVTEVIVGCGVYKNSTGAITYSMINIGGIYTSDQGITVCVNGANQVIVATSSSYARPGTTLGTSTATISNQTWHYLEARAKLHATAGEVEVYLDGIQILNLINVNTATGSITSYQSVGVGGSYEGYTGNFLFDDLYVLDKSGTTNNNFLGPISVYSLMPTGAGSSTQLTPVGVANNWDAVNDAAADDATTHVTTSAVGNKDFYTFEDLPGTVTTVAGVQIKGRSTAPVSGLSRAIYNLKDGINTISSNIRNLSLGTWLYDTHPFDTAPDGAAWTPAKVNSTEGGVEAG